MHGEPQTLLTTLFATEVFVSRHFSTLTDQAL